jgi:hypothetical protein
MKAASFTFRPSRQPEVSMRATACGVIVGLAMLAWAVGFPEAEISEAQVPRPAGQDRAVATSDLIALSYDAGGTQQVTIVDPRGRSVAVYHVDRVTGGLSLKSVRNIAFDLQIEDFNSNSPTPREIRALTDQR